jgi:hypothetical protein
MDGWMDGWMDARLTSGKRKRGRKMLFRHSTPPHRGAVDAEPGPSPLAPAPTYLPQKPPP